jgi:hypothetical protein
MSLSLPYSRNRRYLTGIDWVVGALHHANKKATGSGATSQAILDIPAFVDEAPLRTALNKIAERFPLIHGQFARDWFNLAPYWKTPRWAKNASIVLKVVNLSAGEEEQADRLLTDHVNTPMEDDNQHIRFLLIRIGVNHSRLGLQFDHRLFDAFGAEAFFRLIDETFRGNLDSIAPQINITEPAHLDKWKQRFAAGKALNRSLMELQKKDVRALEMPVAGQYRIHLVHETMTAEQTARINKKAFEEIGMPILLPITAARAVDAMQKSIGKFPLEGQQYLLFTSANMRPPGNDWASLFFNHFSFVNLAAPTNENQTIREVALVLRDQFFQHAKDKIPQAMQDAAALGRIFPQWAVAKVINSMFKGRMCSFYFACLKECGYPGNTFMGHPITNLYHTPLAFAPPGMNLCMTFYAGHFNLVLSYVEGAMEDDTAKEILRRFKTSLCEG